ncbi:M15 family metallopeptidase, partial [Roseisolibacter sp. H3M3-2]|uniref:M15 family metallopeptidase n=1 Tax=Roseisolibacter sp. H3M3-2 TaxID=3031323 RepID=UPI0023DA755B
PAPATRPSAPAATAAPPQTPPAAAVAPPAPDSAIAPDAVAESLLVDLEKADPTIRVEARYATPFNFVGEPLPGYEAPRALLRREAAEALVRVQRALAAEGLGLKVFDGYRPVRATAAMVAWTRRVQREDLLRDGYIAERSRHNLGLAVDLTLVRLDGGRELKMGTAFDTFSRAAHTANASGEAAVNRRRLVRAMQAEGFTNLAEEWWHFAFDAPDPLRFDLPIRAGARP